MSWLVGGMGIVNVLAAGLLPRHAGFERMESLLPLGFAHGPRMLLLFTGILLWIVAGALRRSQRFAWWAALFLLLVTTALQFVLGVSKLESLSAFGFFLLMVGWRKEFTAPSDPASMRRALTTAFSAALVVPLLSWLAVLALHTEFIDFPGTLRAAVDVLRRLVYLHPHHLHPTGYRGDWLLEAIPFCFWVFVLLSLWNALRALRAPRPVWSERMRARELALEHGCTGTAYMATWAGNSLLFAPGERAFLAYRVQAGVAVALGDPTGPSDARGTAVREFLALCRRRGWIPAVFGASEAEARSYADCGLQLLHIGEEAILELGQVDFKGRHWQNMRTALNRARKEGIEFRIFEGGQIPVELTAQMGEIDEEWRRRQELPPLEFTLGREEDVHDPAVQVAVAVDASGRVHGYVDWLPISAENGWVIDLMRRRADAMSGTMEFLIGRSLLAFQERGDRFASLAAAPLADLERSDDRSLVPRVLGVIFKNFKTFYDFDSLFDFKERFDPHWRPLYLAYQDPLDLPTIALAILRVHLPRLGWIQVTQLLGTALSERLRSMDPSRESSGVS